MANFSNRSHLVVEQFNLINLDTPGLEELGSVYVDDRSRATSMADAVSSSLLDLVHFLRQSRQTAGLIKCVVSSQYCVLELMHRQLGFRVPLKMPLNETFHHNQS